MPIELKDLPFPDWRFRWKLYCSLILRLTCTLTQATALMYDSNLHVMGDMGFGSMNAKILADILGTGSIY